MFYDDSMWEAFKLLHYYSSKLLDDMLYDHEVNGSNIQERLQNTIKKTLSASIHCSTRAWSPTTKEFPGQLIDY